MKAYITTSGIVFALVALAHVWRVSVEGIHVLNSFWFVFSTLLAIGLSAWAWVVFKRLPRA